MVYKGRLVSLATNDFVLKIVIQGKFMCVYLLVFEFGPKGFLLWAV